MKTTYELLADTGEKLWGPSWIQPMLGALAAYRPGRFQGQPLARRSFEAWRDEGRQVPAWVVPALPALVRAEAARREAEARALLKLADRVDVTAERMAARERKTA